MKISELKTSNSKQLFLEITNENIEAVKHLLSNIPSELIDINYVDESSRDTSLSKAVLIQNIELVKLLLSYRPELGKIVIKKISLLQTEFDYIYANLPLEIACKNGNVDIIKMLIEYGAILHDMSDHSYTIQQSLEASFMGKQIANLQYLTIQEEENIVNILNNQQTHKILVNSFINTFNSSRFLQYNEISLEVYKTMLHKKYDVTLLGNLLDELIETICIS